MGVLATWHMRYRYAIIWSMNKQQATITIQLNEQDRQIIALIKEFYGVVSDNGAIHIALNEMLREIDIGSYKPYPKQHALFRILPEYDDAGL